MTQTAELYGSFWRRHTPAVTDRMIEAFYVRLRSNDFPLDYFEGKACLDAGSGSGRSALGMSRLGAVAYACDLAPTVQPGVFTDRADILDMPYPDNMFDFVWCSGVVHHTEDPAKGLAEIRRVLRPEGKAFFLVYKKGPRWDTINQLREQICDVSLSDFERAIVKANLPILQCQGLIDDLYVPNLRTYTQVEWEGMLTEAGFSVLEWWKPDMLLDHTGATLEARHFGRIALILSQMGIEADCSFHGPPTIASAGNMMTLVS